MSLTTEEEAAEVIRVRGLVQGVGFRPTVWRLAREHGLRGSVVNDGEGVTIHVCGTPATIGRFVDRLLAKPPLLARIERLERTPGAPFPLEPDFRISSSTATPVHTGIVPDAASCADCRAEIRDPHARRHRYSFTNCTQCGPRLSIIEAIPYDRSKTTMRRFRLCPSCSAEYHDPDDRRFHAQPIACPRCGPRVWLEPPGQSPDAIAAACELLRCGKIVAIKGLGGFQLACDATNQVAVVRLRQLKRRAAKPFALMAADLASVRRICEVTKEAARLLESPAGPIVIMPALPGSRVAGAIASGIHTLGCMLPNTPLHHLLMQDLDRPLVMTSGNASDEPQCVSNEDARERLSGIADSILMHDRDIARRVDDSVIRVMAGAPRLLRRARGFSPAPITLPDSFGAAPAILAMGAELKNSFCLLHDGHAVLSHHIGNLENARTFTDYTRSIDQYCALFEHARGAIAVDAHPDYLSSKLGRERALASGERLFEVQHHHAHIAACMVENGIDRLTAPVLGVALDGLGYGTDGRLWGGEFLLTDYRRFERVACFKPVAMPGGARAVREPWRMTYAHLRAAGCWPDRVDPGLRAFLADKPLAVLDGMIDRGINAPLASSCGRLFDAVAAVIGICRDRAYYEGQPAIELEALAQPDERSAYAFAIERQAGRLILDPSPMWHALLADSAPPPVKAARFQNGLAIALVDMIDGLCTGFGIHTVALTGGALQNGWLLERMTERLSRHGTRVLTHRLVPAGDGGLALGQAAVAAAILMNERESSCAWEFPAASSK
jgi:hydrogenase maturation protein HypF